MDAIEVVAGDDVEEVELPGRLEQRRDLAHRCVIEAALERIEAGTYGLCDECGGPIGEGRLGAIPEATRCVDCAA